MHKWQVIVLSLVVICNICMGVLLFRPVEAEEVAPAIVLKEGHRGSDVKKVQTKLRDLGFFNSNIDGVYGWRTRDAVKKFQRSKGLKADGVVGKDTLKAMGLSNLGGGGNTSYSESDLYLLAKCIYAESRGEPYVGQVAVGAVVLNRVRSSDFPNSIAGVIYQPWAFTAVNDGQINLEPDAFARKAAKDAMSGWDPTHGCLYYYNPAKTTNKWIWSREVRLVIGRHRFAV